MLDEIIQQAIKQYGNQTQVGVAQEECAELIQALSKWIRGKADLDNIAEEIADVEIMCSQLRIIFDNAEQVEMWKEYKLLRLKGRMENDLIQSDNTNSTKNKEE